MTPPAPSPQQPPHDEPTMADGGPAPSAGTAGAPRPERPGPADGSTAVRGADAPSSPWSGPLRATTVGMVAIVALSAFEQLAVATAMPTVADALGGLALYATAFAAPLASGVVGMTVAGSWTDRSGPRSPLLTGVALFVAGLLVAGLAPSMLLLVVGRIVQGLGSGATVVALYVLVARVYPEALRARVFAAFSAAWVVPGIVGPALAGIVVEHIGWRWVFLAVPFLAVPAAFALWPALADPLTRHGLGTGAAGGVDDAAPVAERRWGPFARHAVAGSVVAGAGVLLLHHGGQERGVGALPWLVGGLLALVLTVPALLPPGTLVGRRGLPAAVALRGFVGAAFFGTEIFLPLLLQTERGLSASQAGIMLTASTVTWALGSWVRGRTVERPDAVLLLVGSASLLLGIGSAALLVWSAWPLVAGFLGWGFAGFGMGLVVPTLSLLVLRVSPPEQQGANSSSLQVVDGVGTATMLALSGALFTAIGGPDEPRAFLAGFAITGVAALLAALTARRTRVG